MSRVVLVTTSSFGQKQAPELLALAEAGIELRYNPFGRRLTEAEALELFAGADPVGVVAGVEPLTARVLEAAPGLKAVARCGTGLDSVDLAAAERLGIKVSNTPDAPAAAVSELAMALIFAALRRVAEADRAIRAGAWKPQTGGLLAARSVGVVGLGRIGRRVASFLRPYGGRILGYDPYPGAEVPGVEMVPLDRLIAEADIITLHAPPGAVRLGAAEFAAMRKGAIVVNTARGDLIDEAALHDALSSGHLGGAGLDVFQEEPYRGPLTALETVVMTAHMGSYAAEARALQETEAARNLLEDLRRLGLLP